MLTVTFRKSPSLALTFHAVLGYSVRRDTGGLPLDLRCVRGSPAARHACCSGDLIRFALITVSSVTIYGCINVRERVREGEGVIESEAVSLSNSQVRCYCVSVFSRGVSEQPKGESKRIS